MCIRDSVDPLPPRRGQHPTACVSGAWHRALMAQPARGGTTPAQAAPSVQKTPLTVRRFYLTLRIIKSLRGHHHDPVSYTHLDVYKRQALYSGAHVLGTPVSFRGFDRFLSLPGVHQHAQPAAFQQAVYPLLQTPTPIQDAASQTLRQTLLWQHTLACVCLLYTSRCV